MNFLRLKYSIGCGCGSVQYEKFYTQFVRCCRPTKEVTIHKFSHKQKWENCLGFVLCLCAMFSGHSKTNFVSYKHKSKMFSEIIYLLGRKQSHKGGKL